MHISRPTFIFLKGETKVDEVKGANKAYVLLSLLFHTANVGLFQRIAGCVEKAQLWVNFCLFLG